MKPVLGEILHSSTLQGARVLGMGQRNAGSLFLVCVSSAVVFLFSYDQMILLYKVWLK